MSTNNMDRFEFRCIRPEETQQAIEIEQICFPPNEACSPKSLTERIKATAETFLVAEDKETGKLAAFLNGVPTDEEAFRDEFFTDISLSNPEDWSKTTSMSVRQHSIIRWMYWLMPVWWCVIK